MRKEKIFQKKKKINEKRCPRHLKKISPFCIYFMNFVLICALSKQAFSTKK